MSKKPKNAISPTREEDYPEWYQQVIKAADLAENSPSRGCMIIKPWGWGIWEQIQSALDAMIKEGGAENAYFPLFIPLNFLEREAKHVEGFAKECAVVTHHRLEAKDGKLVPTGELEEPFIVRPTSETIIGDAFSRWVQSYRDLPLLINQWANVVRWEMRPRMFLRTAEFLWQEGHTVHADEECARKEVHRALEMYRVLAEDYLALPVIMGEKTETERFPGAVSTLCIEAMMQDRKALQAGTSHYLGTNFSQACGINFLDEKGEQKLGHTTSWGVSTRLVGGLIMTHADDDGLRVPPKIAPKHAVVLPVIPKDEQRAEILEYTEGLSKELRELQYAGKSLVVEHDTRDLRGGEKSWSWVKKGIPIRIEVGPRDIESGSVVIFRRDQNAKEKIFLKRNELVEKLPSILDEIQANYFKQAKNYQAEHTTTKVKNLEEMKEYFTPKNKNKPEIHAGFVLAPYAESKESEKLINEFKVTVRCFPLNQDGSEGNCVVSGQPTKKKAIFAKSY